MASRSTTITVGELCEDLEWAISLLDTVKEVLCCLPASTEIECSKKIAALRQATDSAAATARTSRVLVKRPPNPQVAGKCPPPKVGDMTALAVVKVPPPPQVAGKCPPPRLSGKAASEKKKVAKKKTTKKRATRKKTKSAKKARGRRR